MTTINGCIISVDITLSPRANCVPFIPWHLGDLPYENRADLPTVCELRSSVIAVTAAAPPHSFKASRFDNVFSNWISWKTISMFLCQIQI